MAEPVTFASEEEAAAWLRGTPIAEPSEGPQALINPLLEKAVGLIPGERAAELAKEARPGTPLQIRPANDNPFPAPAFSVGNVSPWMRFQTARRQNAEDQKAYLESKVGAGNVRQAKTGDFIITVPDKSSASGKRDVVLNETGASVGDLAALAAHAPEMGVALLGMALPEAALPAGAIRTIMMLLGGAAGQKIGEAGQQIETRLEQGTPPQVWETIKEKAKETPGQAALDITTFGVLKLLSQGQRLMRGGAGIWETDIQKQGKAAAEGLAVKYGQPLSYSAGEASGSPLFGYLEAYAGAKPQAASIIEDFRQTQLREAKALANAMTSTGTDEQVGSELLTALQDTAQRKQQLLDSVRSFMTKDESDALTKLLGKSGPVRQPFLPAEQGELFRQSYNAIYKGVKGKVSGAYADAYAVPGAKDDVVPTTGIKQTINSLLDQFPTVEGAQWLRAYEKAIPEAEAYRDIVQRRSDLWNRIEDTPADRQTKDFIHSQLSSSMTDTLDNAAKNILNPAFKAKIEKANAIYKDTELPFYQKGLHDILLKAGARGSPENIDLLSRFSDNVELYRRLVDVAGPKSQPVKVIKSAIIDGLISKSGTSALDPQWIDAKTFLQNLGDLKGKEKTRELFSDVFGKKGDALIEQGTKLGVLQGSIKREEAEAIVQGDKSLSAVLDAQKALNESELAGLLERPEKVQGINPETYINTIVPTATESQLNYLSDFLRGYPVLNERVQNKLAEQILGKAGTFESWDKSSIMKVLHDPKLEPKYREILKDKFSDLEDFATALGPRQYTAEMARGTGMLIKGESIGELARIFTPVGPENKPGIGARVVKAIPGWMGWKMAARIVTSDSLRQWAANALPDELPYLVQAAILTEPVVESLSTDGSSPEVLKNAVLSMKSWFNRNSQPGAPAPIEQPTFRSKQEVLDYLRR